VRYSIIFCCLRFVVPARLIKTKRQAQKIGFISSKYRAFLLISTKRQTPKSYIGSAFRVASLFGYDGFHSGIRVRIGHATATHTGRTFGGIARARVAAVDTTVSVGVACATLTKNRSPLCGVVWTPVAAIGRAVIICVDVAHTAAT
jgi:hypothetical protein